jgi:hypothetical protein
LTSASTFINAIGTASANATGHIADHNNLKSALTAHDNILSSTASLITAMDLETGTGSLVFNTNPQFSGTASLASASFSGNITASLGNTYLNAASLTGAASIGGALTASVSNVFLSTTASMGSSLIASASNTLTFTNKTASALQLSAGTTASPSLFISTTASGSLMTTPTAGAIEFDGLTPLFTVYSGSSAATANRGVLQSSLIRTASITAQFLNQTAAQPLFVNAPTGAYLNAGTAYTFEINFAQTGAASVAVSLGLLFAGTVGVSSIFYTAINTASAFATASGVYGTSTASITVTPSNQAAKQVYVSGILRTTTAGTFIPQVTFSAAPGTTASLAVNSYMRISPIGASAIQTTGGTTAGNGWL